MLINKSGSQIIPNPQDKCYSFGSTKHYVSGFFYIPGFKAGQESVNEVQRSLSQDGSIPFTKMYGAYTYCIDTENETYLFAANGRMGMIYYGEHAAGNRLLDLVRYYRSENIALTFDVNAVCEYLTLKRVFFRKTIINGLSCLPSDIYIYISHHRNLLSGKRALQELTALLSSITLRNILTVSFMHSKMNA